MTKFEAAYYRNAQRANCDKLFNEMMAARKAAPQIVNRTAGTVLTQLTNAVRIVEAAHR